MVVGGKQRLGADILCNVLDDGPRNAHAVIGRGAAAHLVKDKQAARGGTAQDLGHLVHLDHEGRLPLRQVIRSADAGEDAVDNADGGAAGRHKGSDLRHQRDKGHLPHIGRFAGHVGAGDDADGKLAAVEQAVIGDKQAVGLDALDNGVAAGQYLDAVAAVDGGTHIIVGKGALSVRADDVEPRHGSRRKLHAAQRVEQLQTQLFKDLALQTDRALAGAQDLLLQLLELLGDIALASCQRLLADKAVGHHGQVALGDLYVVAEHTVIADLELADARLLLELGLHRGKIGAGVGQQRVQLVDLLRKAAADVAAVLHDGRGVRVDGALDLGQQVRQRIKLTVYPFEVGAAEIA